MQRVGSVIRLRPEHEQEYIDLHRNAWPAVREQISRSGIRNYTIFLRDGYLFSYFEHDGEDLEADLEEMAKDPVTQQWWALCNPCQEPLATALPGEHWAPMVEVFHHA